MNRIFRVVLSVLVALPIIGILLPYIFVFTAYIKVNRDSSSYEVPLYGFDPLRVGLDSFYSIAYYMLGIGVFSIVFPLGLILFFLVKKQLATIKIQIILFLVGIMANIILIKFDPYFHLSWFFD